MNKDSSVVPFLIAFMGMVLAGCALILLIPTLFRPHEPWQTGAAVALGCLALALGWFAQRLRPPKGQDRTSRP